MRAVLPLLPIGCTGNNPDNPGTDTGDPDTTDSGEETTVPDGLADPFAVTAVVSENVHTVVTVTWETEGDAYYMAMKALETMVKVDRTFIDRVESLYGE